MLAFVAAAAARLALSTASPTFSAFALASGPPVIWMLVSNLLCTVVGLELDDVLVVQLLPPEARVYGAIVEAAPPSEPVALFRSLVCFVRLLMSMAPVSPVSPNTECHLSSIQSRAVFAALLMSSQ